MCLHAGWLATMHAFAEEALAHEPHSMRAQSWYTASLHTLYTVYSNMFQTSVSPCAHPCSLLWAYPLYCQCPYRPQGRARPSSTTMTTTHIPPPPMHPGPHPRIPGPIYMSRPHPRIPSPSMHPATTHTFPPPRSWYVLLPASPLRSTHPH